MKHKRSIPFFKICFILFLACIFSVNAVQAQKERKNVVKIQPFALGLGLYGLGYERVLTEKMSVSLSVNYYSKDLGKYVNKYSAGFSNATLKFSGLSITPDFRYYLSKKGAPRGFYVGAYVQYFNITGKGTGLHQVTNEKTMQKEIGKFEGKASINGFGVGPMIGVQGLIGGRVSVELLFGLGFQSYKIAAEGTTTTSTGYVENYKLNDNDFKTSYGGVGGRGSFTVGVAF